MKTGADTILQPRQAAYLASLEPKRDAVLEQIEAYARDHGHPISDPEVGSFLAVAVRAHKPKRIVELGTNIGYGAIVLARAGGPDALLLTIEADPLIAAQARHFIEEAHLSRQIEVREGLALDELQRVEGGIDFLYIDCVKREYPQYLELALTKMARGGVIVADNALWMGLVATEHVPEAEREATLAMRTFNKMIVSHPALQGVVLPLGDGVAYATIK